MVELPRVSPFPKREQPSSSKESFIPAQSANRKDQVGRMLKRSGETVLWVARKVKSWQVYDRFGRHTGLSPADAEQVFDSIVLHAFYSAEHKVNHFGQFGDEALSKENLSLMQGFNIH